MVAEHRHERKGRAARPGGKRHRRAAAVTAWAIIAFAFAAAILALGSAPRALRALRALRPGALRALPPLEECQLQPEHRQQLLAARAPVQLHPASLAERRA